LLLIFGSVLLIGGIAVYLFSYAGATASPANTQASVVEADIPYPNVVRISLEEAKARSDAGTAVLLDVRPIEDYQALHAANAISIPLTELPHRSIELDKAAEYLIYCT
jgi:3-mercaptopyruvate sulfurtransferase SseA